MTRKGFEGKIIKVSSRLPASVDEIWDKLQRFDTLQYIARPYATFAPIDGKDLIWREGETSRFKLRLFGFLPFGAHTINVVTFDRIAQTVQTREGNKRVPIWNHKITLKSLSDGETEYTDEVELFANRATSLVYVWGVIFYRHRQRKWRKLLRGSQSS
jgi:hypothetical protein